MKDFMIAKATLVWLCLILLTSLSWWLSDGDSSNSHSQTMHVAISLIAMAMFKIRLVVIHFMEIGGAPWRLRGLLEGWIVMVFVGITFLYWLTP